MSVIEALFPKVRAELVRLLFADPAKELHLRQLSRLSQLAVGTLQKEVAKLSLAGLITARRDGNRLYYRANTVHPVFPDLQGIALKTTGLREILVDALSELPAIQLAFVFGSEASGKARAESDIDLLVIGGVGLRQLAPRLRPAVESLGREINPHVMSVETLRKKSLAGDLFIKNVLSGPKIFIVGGPDELGTMV